MRRLTDNLYYPNMDKLWAEIDDFWPMESKVMHLLYCANGERTGMTVSAAARQLGIQPKDVRRYEQSAFKKLYHPLRRKIFEGDRISSVWMYA